MRDYTGKSGRVGERYCELSEHWMKWDYFVNASRNIVIQSKLLTYGRLFCNKIIRLRIDDSIRTISTNFVVFSETQNAKHSRNRNEMRFWSIDNAIGLYLYEIHVHDFLGSSGFREDRESRGLVVVLFKCWQIWLYAKRGTNFRMSGHQTKFEILSRLYRVTNAHRVEVEVGAIGLASAPPSRAAAAAPLAGAVSCQ
jgi:hypothetical protein